MTDKALGPSGEMNGRPEELAFKLTIEGEGRGPENDHGLAEKLTGLHPSHLMALASRCAVSVVMAGGLLEVRVNREILMALLRGVAVPA